VPVIPIERVTLPPRLTVWFAGCAVNVGASSRPAIIRRMVLFPASATYTIPELSTQTSPGVLNSATDDSPSMLLPTPATPATVVTKPVGSILRMRSLVESAT
jgi:hypothetical protein